MIVKGAYTAIVTPFNENGELDEEGLRLNIRYQIKNGVDGIAALGTTGEAPTLSEQEKEKIICIASEETKGKIKLMVGTGSYSTQQTIENTKKAKKFGAEIVLIVIPYYNKPTQEGLYKHFKAVAEAVDIPIMVYNIQGRTGQNLQTETLKRLANIPNIIGVKEASGNILQMMEVIEAIHNQQPEFSVMSGDDALTLPLMTLGGHGIISVVSNLLPYQVKALVTALQEKEYEKARQIHYNLLPLFRNAFIETNPIPIKAAMKMKGMAAGSCRLPLCDLMPENLAKLANSVRFL